MFFRCIVAAVALASAVSAQAGANSTIDAGTVDPTTRSLWCNAQMNTCGTLCPGAFPNTCDVDTLAFNCTCLSNSSTPGLQYYTGTIPTFICEYNFGKCINESVGVAASQAKCNADEKANCGHLNPDNFVEPVSTSASSSEATAAPTSAVSSATAAASATSTSSKGAAATMLALGGDYGTGIVAVGVAAAFGIML